MFAGLTSLTRFCGWTTTRWKALPAGGVDNLTTLQILRLDDNLLTELSAGVFDNLTALTTLALDDNALPRLLPDDVFEPLTLLTDLRLSGNPGGPYRHLSAVALPDGGTVLDHRGHADARRQTAAMAGRGARMSPTPGRCPAPRAG